MRPLLSKSIFLTAWRISNIGLQYFAVLDYIDGSPPTDWTGLESLIIQVNKLFSDYNIRIENKVF